MKIAVTGAAGTIGTPLCADLARDHEVVRIDLHDADVIADTRDVDALTSAFADCETVVHLAGIPDVEASWEQVLGPNIAGTYATFEAARRAGVKRLIFASSNHAVGMYEVDNLPAIYEIGFGLLVRHRRAASTRLALRRMEGVRRGARAVLQRRAWAAGDMRTDRIDHQGERSA